MPTIAEQWLYAIPIALVAFHASKLRWWLGLIALVWPVMLIKGGTLLYFHDFVGESELYENSQVYFFSIACSALLVLFATGYGVWLGRKRVLEV